MAATDGLRHYVKRQSTVQGKDGLYLDDEFDKISQSIKNLNDTVKTISVNIPLTSLAAQITGTFLGNISGSTASPVALTATQVTASLNVFTTTLNGLVPSPGTVAGKVLTDSGTWTAISGFVLAANNGSDFTNFTTLRTNIGISLVGHTNNYTDLTGLPTLGTAAAQNTGTAVNNVVQMATGPKLPAVDGSALTNLTQCEPRLTSSTYPVGTALFCFCTGTFTLGNGGAVSGASLNSAVWVSVPVCCGVARSLGGSGAALSGTWTNVSGTTLTGGATGVNAGYLVRTA